MNFLRRVETNIDCIEAPDRSGMLTLEHATEYNEMN